jgi:hypothetical protein
MATRYLEILARQRPFPFDVDDNDRVLFSCNYDALAAAPVTAFEDEIMKLISNAGLGTFGVDSFIGPDAVVPTGDGPYINIIDTGGLDPMETHNGSTYERLSVQIVVRATNFTAARTRALAVWRTLDGVRDTTVAA